MCSYVHRFGGIIAGWLGLLKQYHIYIPTTIYGLFAVIFATLAMALPETKGMKIPDTMEEGEQECDTKEFFLPNVNVNFEFDFASIKQIKLISMRNMFKISGSKGKTEEPAMLEVDGQGGCVKSQLLEEGVV